MALFDFNKDELLNGIRKALNTVGIILLSLGSLIGLDWLTPELVSEGQESILAAAGGILALIAWITGLKAEKKKTAAIKEEIVNEINHHDNTGQKLHK